MEVPEGANLRFDRPLDLNKGGIGRLIEGKLRGPVRIRSQGKRPDHQDDLLVRTHDVDLSEQRITTASDVDFHWGPQLGPRAADGDQALAPPGTSSREPGRTEHRRHRAVPARTRRAAAPGHGFGLGRHGPAAGGPQPQPAGPPMLGTLSAHAAPVEITCRGPFRFHLIEQVATFRDQVDVLRIQPNGPCDHMSCELLSIFFTRPAPPPGAAPPRKKTAPGFDLQPARIEAQGTPTTLTAPMDHLQARAERLQYNLRRRADLPGRRPGGDAAKGRQRDPRAEPSLYAGTARTTRGNSNCWPQAPAGCGAKWPTGRASSLKPVGGEKLEARPQDQNQVISLLGGATLNFQAMGQLDARDIHFWLHESPPENSPLPPGRGAGR